MTIETGLLICSHHVLLGEVVAAPALGGVDVDILWPIKTVHRVVHLHSFPAMIVVVLIKHEVHIGPTSGEERVVALVVRHVHELIYLPPVIPLKTVVEEGITFERRILMYKLAIGHSRSA